MFEREENQVAFQNDHDKQSVSILVLWRLCGSWTRIKSLWVQATSNTFDLRELLRLPVPVDVNVWWQETESMGLRKLVLNLTFIIIISISTGSLSLGNYFIAPPHSYTLMSLLMDNVWRSGCFSKHTMQAVGVSCVGQLSWSDFLAGKTSSLFFHNFGICCS